jgi:TolB-like protein/Flp pilus assembly protein TadD
VIVLLVAVIALNVAGLRDRFWPPTPSVPKIESIAVLPLANLSGDPAQEYFADGMTEELIATLGKLSALRVISRTSAMQYKGARKPLPQIAKELNVDAVIEGSVLRVGDRVRITAQLIQASTDKHLWAETYDRDLRDVLALQSEVAQAITREIRTTLTPQEQTRLAGTRPVNPEAYELYLKGIRARSAASDIEPSLRAKELFQQAIEKDPTYAPAYAALARHYNDSSEAGHVPYAEASSKAKALALRALAIDDSLAEAHAAVAYAALYLDWDWLAANRESQRALELNPNSAEARGFRSFYLSLVGQTEEAIREAKRAVELDPLTPSWYLQSVYYFDRQYDQVLEAVRMFQEINPKWDDPWDRAAALCEKGKYGEAIAVFKSIQGPHAWGHLGNAYARLGKRTEAQEMIPKLKERVQKDKIGTYEIALVYAGLGEKDQAFEWLEKAYQVRDKGMCYLKVDPPLDPLRSDPRFQDFLRRMNFPP